MKHLIYLILLLSITKISAQESNIYQNPPQEILDLVDVPQAPSIFLDDNKEHMILLFRDSYKSIEELSQEELRLGGLRIDPKTNIGSRVTYFNNIKIKHLKNSEDEISQVKGLPTNPKLTNFKWSPDQSKLALTNTTQSGVEVWILDINTSSISKLTNANINANIGDVINWFEDSQSILIKTIPANRKPLINTKTAIPVGPTISINDGKKAQNRTYQDLLKNKNNEHNFEQLALSEIYKVSLDGKKEKWLESDMFASINFSPDGNYILVNTISRPFSYIVPYRRFPSKTTVYTKEGKKIETVNDVPLIEDLPKGFMAVKSGKRNFRWRNDKPSTLVYVVALDGGDPENKVDFRDEVFELEAPFNKEGKSILKTIGRFYNMKWGNNSLAIASDYWWNTRNTKSYLFNPSDATQKPVKIVDRNYQDKYNDPGGFVTERNEMGSSVLSLIKGNAFLLGDGFTDKGQFPFVDQLDLKTNKSKRIYQSTYTDKIEDLRSYDPKNDKLLIRIESAQAYPNYYLRSLKNDKLTQLTSFANPFVSIQNVHKEVIKYKREDGLELSGTLYLPVGYDKNSKEKVS